MNDEEWVEFCYDVDVRFAEGRAEAMRRLWLWTLGVMAAELAIVGLAVWLVRLP